MYQALQGSSFHMTSAARVIEVPCCFWTIMPRRPHSRKHDCLQITCSRTMQTGTVSPPMSYIFTASHQISFSCAQRSKLRSGRWWPVSLQPLICTKQHLKVIWEPYLAWECGSPLNAACLIAINAVAALYTDHYRQRHMPSHPPLAHMTCQ